MRICFPILAAIVLAACSDAPVAEKTKAPEKPSAPITGRQAFQMTYPSARTWAADCQPVLIRSLNLTDPKSSDGKAGAWEIQYVSVARGRARSFTWSAIESEGNLHKGVFGTPDEPWGGPHGQEKPFLAQALKIDTTEALATAIEKSGEYLKKGGATKPQVSFMCELTQRFPDPAWRVFWGESVSSAEWSVFIDASTGQYLGR